MGLRQKTWNKREQAGYLNYLGGIEQKYVKVRIIFLMISSVNNKMLLTTKLLKGRRRIVSHCYGLQFFKVHRLGLENVISNARKAFEIWIWRRM